MSPNNKPDANTANIAEKSAAQPKTATSGPADVAKSNESATKPGNQVEVTPVFISRRVWPD